MVQKKEKPTDEEVSALHQVNAYSCFPLEAQHKQSTKHMHTHAQASTHTRYRLHTVARAHTFSHKHMHTPRLSLSHTCTQQEILDAYMTLFETHKHALGWGDKELKIV